MTPLSRGEVRQIQEVQFNREKTMRNEQSYERHRVVICTLGPHMAPFLVTNMLNGFRNVTTLKTLVWS